MADSLYDYGREGFLAGDIDWDGDNIKLVLIDEADDTINLASDQDLADRAAGSRDAANVTFTAVTGDQAESIDCYQDTGTEATSRLIFNIDAATNLPVTPNGGDIVCQWSDGSNKIFRL